MLALFQFDLGGRADLDYCNAASQLGQSLLQLLAVIIGIGILDLATDLRDSTSDLLSITCTINDGGLVLGHGDRTRPAQ